MAAASTATAANIVIVTGLAGAGKSQFTRYTEFTYPYKVKAFVEADKFRYEPGTWNKLPLATFVSAVHKAIDDASKISSFVVLDTTYNDAHDAEQARQVLVDGLIRDGRVALVVMVVAKDRKHQASMLIQRCINRATGNDTSSSSPETFESRGALLCKNILNFDANVEALKGLERKCAERAIPCFTTTLDDIMTPDSASKTPETKALLESMDALLSVV